MSSVAAFIFGILVGLLIASVIGMAASLNWGNPRPDSFKPNAEISHAGRSGSTSNE